MTAFLIPTLSFLIAIAACATLEFLVRVKRGGRNG